ncbi:hypothetical protein HU200_067343 [Digitaria exilis]|uniref:Uncharacterized protein n=1 Tax=Digitaria exilis TaxID=1010633 RepID=A0A835A0K6_9POAL|nr:hypothetical protein HU200_067343 [Digitaria exilis]
MAAQTVAQADLWRHQPLLPYANGTEMCRRAWHSHGHPSPLVGVPRQLT